VADLSAAVPQGGAVAMPRGRIIAAGLIGNVMEWYDFAVYGYFASVIGHLFFPSTDPAVSLIAAFGAFAAGFLVRPLGGILFGRVADLMGRKRALTLSVVAMAVPTVSIGFLPSYETIGIAAPVLIVLLRIVQGLSVGGEYTCSLVFLAEHAGKKRRAFYAIWGFWGAVAGILLGSAVGDVLTNVVDDQTITDWAWRLPFLLGALVAGTGLLVRRAIHTDAPANEGTRPVLDAFGKHRNSVIRVIFLNIANGVGFYAAFVYAVTYIKEIDHLPARIAFNLNTGAMALLLVIAPLAALLADRIGRRPVIVAGAAIIAAGAIPLFVMIHGADPMLIFAGEVGFVLGVGLLNGGLAGANVELIPSPVRCTGLAFAYNAAIGYFGGTTPLIAAWLITSTGNPIAPAYWIAACGLVTLTTAVFFVRETRDLAFK
jgi:MHS family proline/betaine transporter-like MFS transporter